MDGDVKPKKVTKLCLECYLVRFESTRRIVLLIYSSTSLKRNDHSDKILLRVALESRKIKVPHIGKVGAKLRGECPNFPQTRACSARSNKYAPRISVVFDDRIQ